MPPQKASPHRFLLSTSSPKPAPKPAQSLPPKPPQTPAKPLPVTTRPRHSTPHDLDALHRKTTAKRFVFTPTQHARAEAQPDAPHAHTPRPKPKPLLSRLESIEDSAAPAASPRSSDDEILFDVPSTTKRRRIELDADTPATTPLRSLAQTLDTPSTTTTTTTTTHRPAFIIPRAASPGRAPKHVTELFSPSRKAHRYVPGGLAATAQGWILETASAGYAAQGGRTGPLRGREGEDGVRMRVRVAEVGDGAVASGWGMREKEGKGVECVSAGIVYVRGCVEVGGGVRGSSAVGEGDEGGEVAVLLAGLGGARGTGSVLLKEGCLVGIRAPVWDVDVGGETWTVGVDWVVL